jgi:hypothetical protein
MDQRIDVALLVRPHVEPRPTPLEDGVICALRKGIPLVEDGPDLLDPYDPWVAERVATELDVVAACNRAAERSLEPLRTAILDRIGVLTRGLGLRADQIGCRVQPEGTALRVEVLLPVAVDRHLEQALAVRVLDAVRGGGKTYGEINVTVATSEAGARPS